MLEFMFKIARVKTVERIQNANALFLMFGHHLYRELNDICVEKNY